MTDNTRNLIRGVSVFIIVMTIPFYLCGIVIWSTPSDNDADPITDPDLIFTPIDPGNFSNDGDAEATITPLFTPIDPGNFDDNDDFDPPIAATNTRQIDIGFTQVVPPTVLPPTATHTRTPTPTPPPTDTLAPTLTSLPTATSIQPIIPPASDTPTP